MWAGSGLFPSLLDTVWVVLFSLPQFLLIFRKAAAGELQEDSGLHVLARLSEIDVSTEGVKGAKSFFEAKVRDRAGGRPQLEDGVAGVHQEGSRFPFLSLLRPQTADEELTPELGWSGPT